MAIMAPDIQVVKRSEGRSSVAIAAYRAAALLYDERTGERFDYTRKSGVIHTEIIAPQGVPEWVYDRQQLWANVELANRRKDAQVAREFMLPLPHELGARARLALVRQFVKDVLVSQGMIADIAIHLPERRGDQRNHHAHITCTMRHIGPDGFGMQAREWNDDFAALKKLYALKKTGQAEEAEKLEAALKETRPIFDWRAQWAAYINNALAAAGHEVRVDHRSWLEQGIDREAEPHMGVEATNMERRGEETDLGNERREVQERNAQREQIEQEINVIELELERKKRQAKSEHLAATALDRTREAVLQLSAFDQGHAEINFCERAISKAIARARKLQNRKAYARRLIAQVERNFEAVYAEHGAKAHGKFWRDVHVMGIHSARRTLLDHPRRYGKLPGWQLGRRIYFSPRRYDAYQLLGQTAELSWQGYFMTRKVHGEEAVEYAALNERVTALKAEQEKLMQAPPEGRLIIQRAIYETARHLRRQDWDKLTGRERFHVMQARQLMKHEDLRAWADGRARTLIAEAMTPAPAKDLSDLVQPVDLKEVSPSYHKAELNKLWAEAKIRHEEEFRTLAAAQKAEREGLAVKRHQVMEKGFTGLLARTTALGHLFEKLYAKRQRALDERHAAMKAALEARHEKELEALSAGYKTVRERVRQRLAENQQEQQRQENAEKRSREIEENKHDIVTPKRDKREQQARENAADITQKKSRGYRRSDHKGYKKHKKRGRGHGFGYGYNMRRRPGPKKDDDDD